MLWKSGLLFIGFLKVYRVYKFSADHKCKNTFYNSPIQKKNGGGRGKEILDNSSFSFTNKK